MCLHVAGNLDQTVGGPDLDPETGLKSPRRSLYFRHAKEKRVTFLRLFDSPNVLSCYRRSDSVMPQQALALANSSLCLEQARLLAGKLRTRSCRTGPVGRTTRRVCDRRIRARAGPIADPRRNDRLRRLSRRAGQAARRTHRAWPPFRAARPRRFRPPPTRTSGHAKTWCTYS